MLKGATVPNGPTTGIPLAFKSFFSLNCGVGPVVSMAFGEENTNAHLNFKKTELARDCSARAGGTALVIDNWSRCAAKRNGGGRKRTAVRDRVLLQGEVGPRGRISSAFQEESLPGSEKRDRVGAHAEGEHDRSTLSHDRRRTVGLPG